VCGVSRRHIADIEHGRTFSLAILIDIIGVLGACVNISGRVTAVVDVRLDAFEEVAGRR
jgi:hypothetical protein